MKATWTLATTLGAVLIGAPAQAQTKVAIGISGWIGFASLTLANDSQSRPARSA